MATSFIKKDGVHGFWISDGLMQVVCWGMVSVIDRDYSDAEPWLKDEYREYMFDNSQGIFIGYMGLDLEDTVNSEERRVFFNTLMDDVTAFFREKGDMLSVEELNAFQTMPYYRRTWLEPLEVASVLKVIQFVKDVINDVCPFKVGDEELYHF